MAVGTPAVGVGVLVGRIGVGVRVAWGVLVCVAGVTGVRVDVFVGVRVMVGVRVGPGVCVMVGVFVAVRVGSGSRVSVVFVVRVHVSGQLGNWKVRVSVNAPVTPAEGTWDKRPCHPSESPPSRSQPELAPVMKPEVLLPDQYVL